jgi:hypothetical protein
MPIIAQVSMLDLPDDLRGRSRRAREALSGPFSSSVPFVSTVAGPSFPGSLSGWGTR